jgi:hypothetical protein
LFIFSRPPFSFQLLGYDWLPQTIKILIEVKVIVPSIQHLSTFFWVALHQDNDQGDQTIQIAITA